MESADVRIPTHPEPGEMWFSINMDLVKPEEIPVLADTLAGLNLTPRSAYRVTVQGVESHLLLWHGKRSQLTESPSELFENEQFMLSEVIDPDAISFRSCLTRPMAA